MTDNPDSEHLVRVMRASQEQLALIDQVLAGDIRFKESPASSGPLLLGMGAAARMLGVSRPTLWRMIQAGRLQKVELLPNSYRIRRMDLEVLVNVRGDMTPGQPGATCNRRQGAIQSRNTTCDPERARR